MLRRVPRALRVALLGTVLLAILASIGQSWVNSTPGAGGCVRTQWGDLCAADRNLLVAVRSAGLWEGPTGQQASLKASREEVQQVGTNLGIEHPELDSIAVDYASRLGVELPTVPTTQQMGWMNELTGLSGQAYDQRFVQIVRAAHGAVLPKISEARVATRNDLIREFAEIADTYVNRHIDYLESTGLVDYNALPAAPSPGLLSADRGPFDLIVPGLVVLSALLAAAGLLSALRRRPRPAPEGGLPGGPPVTGRAIAAIAAAPAARPAAAARSARRRLPAPRPATATDSGAYRITATAEPEPAVPAHAEGAYEYEAEPGDARYADVRYAESRYADAQPAPTQYGQAQHGEAQHGEAQHGDVRYGAAAHATGPYAQAPYADGQYAEYPATQYTEPVPVPETPGDTGPLPRSRRRSRHSVRT